MLFCVSVCVCVLCLSVCLCVVCMTVLQKFNECSKIIFEAMMPVDGSDPSGAEHGSDRNGFINDLSLPNHLLQYAKCSKPEPV